MAVRRLLLLSLPLFLGGCLATQRDVRDLRAEMQASQSAQAALLREIRQEIQRQNALLLDSLSTQDVRLRGDIANRLVQIDRQLIQIQELTGQGAQELNELRQQFRASQEEAARVAAAAASAGGAAGGGATGDAAELFDSAREALDRGSYSTARAGFEEFIRLFPQHERAPAAQLYIGESREKATERAPALAAYGRLVELYPNSTQAPTALYRSALIEVAQNNRARARTLLNQLVTAYPRAPEVAQAREQLNRLR